MKKAGIILYIVLLLPLLTGCWDQLPLSNLKLLDVAGFNLNDRGEVEIHSIETTLKSDGLGNGEQKSVITVETGPSLLKATAKNGLTSRVYYGADTRIYLLSEKFALEYPVSDITFLLDAPYASIHSPVAILEGNLPKYLKDNLKNNEKFTNELNDYILTLEKRRLIPRVSMMDLILSQAEKLQDHAIPVLKQSDEAIEMNGAYLYKQSKNTGVKLSKDQVIMMMLLLGEKFVRVNLTADLLEESKGKSLPNKENKNDIGFSVKEIDSKYTVSKGSKGLPKITIDVNLNINVYDLGTGILLAKDKYISQKEKELSKNLEEIARSTIDSMQHANCDVIGIGKQIKAFHPNIWKGLSWRKDYPQISIQPRFEVQITNGNK